MVSPARRRVAVALRHLGESLLCSDIDDDRLDQIADALDDLAPLMISESDRTEAIDALKVGAYGGSPPDGARIHHNPDCIVCGPGSPAGFELVSYRKGDEVAGQMNIGRLGAGAPGRAHGGLIAAALDDLMGHVLVLQATPAYTVKLDTEYLAASPIDEVIEVRAWLESRERRRLVIKAEARAGGNVTVRAEGLFISVDRL